ncbi:lipocalin-like domain-containing protein, partial [Thermodesulfobacteriota bacterium]
MPSRQLKSAAFLIILLTGIYASAADQSTFRSVTGPCNLEFPRDHGPHPGCRTEWWYYTGNIRSATGKRFGYQLTFFRTRISPSGAESAWPKPASAWRTQQIYMAHAAVSDIDGQRYLHAEESSREALGLAGAFQSSGSTTVFVKTWFTQLNPEKHHLKMISEDFSFELTQIPLKSPVLHGRAGYSRKGKDPARASCYYSFTRLKTDGTLSLGKKTFAVEGTSWMDQEFSTAPLEPGITGWDWFGLQLSDQTELMIYLLRKSDGIHHPASSGTCVEASGKTFHLTEDMLALETIDTWKSPRPNPLRS